MRLSALVLRVNKTIDLEMRVPEMIRQEQWAPAYSAAG